MDNKSFNKNLTNPLIEAIGQLPNSEDLLASLDQALQLVQESLQSFASDPDFDTKMRLAFGEEIDVIALGQAWAVGDFSVIPAIEIRPAAEINGANGAYAAATNTIYLAQEFLEQNAGNPDTLAVVLLEEVGHAVDAQINSSDTPGDEGAAFTALIRGETLDKKQIIDFRNMQDTATIILDGEILEIEQAQSVSDSGGFEGSQQTITLESTEGGVARFRYQHFTIPDNFIIRYEGKNLLETGFTGGSRTGEVQIPKGNSNTLEIIVATNDEGTAWNYDVTVDDCPDTGVLNIELANGEFMDSDEDGDCEGSGTVFLGHKSGINRILRIDGATVEFDDKELRVLDGTVVSLIGNVPEPLFSGNFVVDLKTGSTKSLTDTREPNQFKFGDLVDIDFKSLGINPNNVALTGDFTLPLDLGEVEIKLDGTPNSLIIDNSGARFGGGKVSFPRQEFRFLEQSVPPGLFKVDAKNLSIEYVAADDQLKLQGQLTLKDPITKDENGNFALGSTEVVFDFAGNNFIGIKDGKVDVVGSASVKNIKLPGGWGLNELGISIDTTKGEVKGKTRVSFPFPARSPIPPAFGGQQQAGPDAGLEVGFLLPPPNIRLDSVMADVDKLNIAIGTTGFFFQRVAGSVSNISKPDPIRFGGGIGFSYGPIVTLPIPGLAQDLLGLPSSVDAAVVNVQLNVDSDFQSSIAGSGEVSIISPNLFKIGGMSEYNWDRDFATGRGSLDVISGLVSGTASGRLDIDRGNFDGSGTVSITIPDVSFFGFLKGKRLGSANAQFQYRDDGRTANDFVNAWGEINLGSVNLPIIGEINLGVVDVGIRYKYLEGDVSLLGDNLPLIGSWDVQADSEWVLIGADWKNANSNVLLRVIDPDGNVYEESEFAENGIAIVEQLSDDKTRTVVIGRPKAGIWDIEVVDETGLGEVNYSAIGATDVPEITLLTPAQNTSSDLVNISFEAFDSDSDATISLFYDTDNLDFDGAFITDLTETDGLSAFQWNTEGIATGEYFIYAMAMDDESAPVFSNYSLGKVIVSEETDLSIIQTANTDVVKAGGLVTYTLKVTNNGTVDSSNVVVTETLGEGANFISSTVTPLSQTDNELSFELGNISSGETKTFEIIVAAPTEGETFFSSAYVEGSVFDFDATNDVSTVATTIEPIIPDLPDLVVTRQDNLGNVSLGDTFNYSLTVTNNGQGEATGVVLTETLPSVVNVISATADVEVENNRNLVDLIEIQLDSGENVKIDIDADELGSSLDPILRLFDSTGNEVAVSDDNPAPGEFFTFDSYIDFTASVSDTYYVGVSGFSNFSYNPFIDGSGDLTSSSGSYDLEITVGNDSSITQGVLSEPNNTIPTATDSGLSSDNPGTFITSGFIRSNSNSNPVTISGNTVTANLGNLESGESATVNLTVNSFGAGNLITTTDVVSNEADIDPRDNSLITTTNIDPVIPTSADLELSQTVNNLNPEIGDQISFTLTITNQGPGIASGIEVESLLPAELTFVSAISEQGFYDSNTGIWDVGNVRDNLSRTLQINALVNDSGLITTTSEVIAVNEADPDSVPNNNNFAEDDQVSVTIDVPSNNNPPVANDDNVSTQQDTIAVITAAELLSNDTDIDGDNLSIDSVGNANNGTVSLDNNGNVLFTPDAGFSGDASFTYTITDGNDGTDTALVNTTVIPDSTEPNVVDGTSGRDNLAGTDQDDIITGGQGRDSISTGSGNDVLVYSSIVDAGDIVTDFEVGKDKFDFSQLLNSFGYGGSAPFADGYVQIIANGSSSIITVDTDGVAGSGRARQFILVQNVAAEELNSSDNFKF